MGLLVKVANDVEKEIHRRTPRLYIKHLRDIRKKYKDWCVVQSVLTYKPGEIHVSILRTDMFDFYMLKVVVTGVEK